MDGRCHRNDTKAQSWSAEVHRSSSPESHVLSLAENMILILFGRKAHPEAFLFFFLLKTDLL